MTPKIHILPEQLCNKIAAGEVVERPSSVVKELLENALDAGATDVRIELEGGGKRLIRVTDNGCGMGRDDLLLCLERHATSKIRADADLFALQTLGFRGEALPAIASVSRLRLESRSAEHEEGWQLQAEGGTIRRVEAVGLPVGTRIEIRDLFFNTPARRKFLRRDETELGHIGDMVTRQALARPDVRFSLLHHGRTLLEVFRQTELRDRIGDLLGLPLLRELVTVDAKGPQGLSLRGYLAQPAVHRSSTDALHTYINGRSIRDRLVQHAVLAGYRSLLEKGRYPVAVLFLEIDPALVDVNVHPTKHEVRFREPGPVHDFLAETVREVLRPSGWLTAPLEEIPPPVALSAAIQMAAPPAPSVAPVAPVVATRGPQVQEALESYARRTGLLTASTSVELSPEAAIPTSAGIFSSLEILGQFHRSYILCQDNADLLLIDQHAAHERIAFEQLRRQYHDGRVESQSLLLPVILEPDFRMADALCQHLDDLANLGFVVEPFGPRTLAVQAMPQILMDCDPQRLLLDVAADLVSLGRSGLVEEAVERLLMRMACHGTVRANQALSAMQIRALLQQLDAVDFNAHCPHGRPVLKRLPLTEIERMFHRG
jgi:DNA mismatch repair protein MutL